MTADELRALQAPLKARYQDDPPAALVPLHAEAILDAGGIACRVPTGAGDLVAGLHPATGGDGSRACSGDMLLQALVACAGVTLRAVATAMGIEVRGGRVVAEGWFDARGTLGVRKDVPIGLTTVQLRFELETDADESQLANLLRLTERYCVIEQTLKSPPAITAEIRAL